ncbi:MAG: hypothetical protein IJZ79_03645 [Bacilli bacterium]|nr:hypothetical protein [Bacilli bacterium]MBQ8218823.1 hypothetical protein [Bacilli bacterium]
MDSKEYIIYFENGQVLKIFGSFDNEELVESHKDIALFVEENREYMIPMANVLYIKCENNNR